MTIQPHPFRMSLQEVPDAAEASNVADSEAQVLAWAGRLVELGRIDDARQVYLEALDSAADPVPLTLALAQLECDAGAADRAEELLRRVLVNRPGNLDAARGLAEVLLDGGRVDEAARAVADARASGDHQADKAAAFAELAGETLLRQGRHAAAVEAFGPRSVLTPRGRRMRRRAWWRAGGPLRRRRSPGRVARTGASLSGAAANAPSRVAGTDVPDPMLKAIAWAEWLSSEERFDDARRVLDEAIISYGRHPSLLASAARVEESADARHTALYLWEEAYHQAPGDIDIVCELALSVCYFDARFPYTGRVRDALRILDTFGDQAHPRIRRTRVLVLSYNAPSAARLAAAYGPAAGLPRWQARHRRRLLLRSAGPLGQLSVRVADWIRDRRHQQLDAGPVQRVTAESEAIARVLDTVRGLKPTEASQRIEEAMSEHGRQPSLLLASADLDESEGRFWHCAAMAAEAARLSKGSVDAVCEFALALDRTHSYGTALQVLASLPAAARATVKARATTAALHAWADNAALAAAAFGDPRDLDKYFRSRRRRAALRAVIQRLRSGSSANVAAIDATSFDPVSPPMARVLDKAQSQADDHARETLQAAMADAGRHPLLLLELARTERRDGDDHACAALAKEAMRAAPEDPLIMADGITELWLADYDADALALLDDREGSFRDSAAVHAAAGDVCRYWQLWAHAVEAFGDSGLEAWRWQSRRTCWWHSGGPMGRVRRRIRTAEQVLLRGLKLPAVQEAALTALALPDNIATAVRGTLATHRLDWDWRVLSLPNRRNTRLKRAINAVVLVTALGVLVLVQRARWPTDSIIEDTTAALVSMAAAAVGAWLLGRFSWRRDVTRLGLVALLGVGAWYLLTLPGRIAVGAGLALAVIAAVPLVLYLISQVISFIRRLRIARWQRGEAEMVALDDILSLLGELLAPRRFRDAPDRREWMEEIERLAVIIERDFPHALRSGDPDSQRVIADHARGAASALRRMKATIALPDEAAWHGMTDQLTGLAKALATRDFAGWPTPLPQVTVTRPSRSPWRRVMDGTRTVLVIFAPPLVAFLLPLAVPLSGPGVPWLRFATTVWALLGTIIALDPEWSTRIAKMREWFDVVRSATPPGQSDSGSTPTYPADSYPSQATETRRQPPIRSPRVRTPPRIRR